MTVRGDALRAKCALHLQACRCDRDEHKSRSVVPQLPKVALRTGAPQSQTYPSGPFVGEQCRGHLVV